MLDEVGVIGNCQAAAHVDAHGRVVWCCLPRFDSEPVFGALLDDVDGGAFAIRPAPVDPDSPAQVGAQRYLENTNVLETRFENESGRFRVLDFMPRFLAHGRSFRPTKLVRIVEPISGTPYISVECEPRLGWSKKKPRASFGSNHVSYEGYESELRLTTDVPLAYLGGRPFALTTPRHFVLAYGEPVEEPLAPLCSHFLTETTAYWRRWVKHCVIPPMYQEEVIRSALVLKLHCYEDTGAIVAALTTSIPESPGSGRTWDYRYCWLRDSYYTLDAFRLLGHYEERERFVDFLLGVAGGSPGLDLAPLYRIDGSTDLDERILDSWPGYLGEGPVRVGNQAAKQVQHDVFGEMVLALAPIFFDTRFRDRTTDVVLDLMKRLARKAIAVAGTPDAGIWELRTDARPQTFSSLMCWAAADRMSRISATFSPHDEPEFRLAATRIREQILARAFDDARGTLVATYGSLDLDAALLQAVTLRLLPKEDPRMLATIDAVRADLDHDGWLLRYRIDDGFGNPSVAFAICTYWLIQALATVGLVDEARTLMERVHRARAPLGLLSEDFDPKSGTMWGNYPQAYSHVGLIHAAFAASPSWSEVL